VSKFILYKSILETNDLNRWQELQHGVYCLNFPDENWKEISLRALFSLLTS